MRLFLVPASRVAALTVVLTLPTVAAAIALTLLGALVGSIGRAAADAAALRCAGTVLTGTRDRTEAAVDAVGWKLKDFFADKAGSMGAVVGSAAAGITAKR